MKMNKAFQVTKEVLIISIVVISMLLTACKVVKVEVRDNEGEPYKLEYKGENYFKDNKSPWMLYGDKKIGYNSDLKQVLYRSIGEDENKFIESWALFENRAIGYGLFIREDINLEHLYSGNIGQMSFQGNENEEIRKGIVEVLDIYYNGDSLAIGSEYAYENFTFINSGQFIIEHNEYDLFCKAYYYYFNNTYYISIHEAYSDYIPISEEIGKKLDKIYD